MDYSTLYFWYVVIGKIKLLIIVITICLAIFSFGFFLAGIDPKIEKNLKISKKLFFIFVPFFIISIFFPSDVQYVTYTGLKVVDTYAKENPGSITNPKVIIKTADDLVNVSKKLLNVIDKSADVLDNKLNDKIKGE